MNKILLKSNLQSCIDKSIISLMMCVSTRLLKVANSRSLRPLSFVSTLILSVSDLFSPPYSNILKSSELIVLLKTCEELYSFGENGFLRVINLKL